MTRDEVAQATGLTTKDLDALALLDKATQSCGRALFSLLTDEEHQFVCHFLEQAIGNMELNQRLLELSKLNSKDTGVSFSVLNQVKNVSFKSRRWPEIHFRTEHKMTLAQFGALSVLGSLARDLDVFERTGLLTRISLLSNLHKDAKKAHEIVHSLEEQFFKRFTLLEQAEFLEIKPTKDAFMIPLAQTEYRSNTFDYQEFLYSDDYRIKLDRFINPEMQEYLKKPEHLGENWLQHLERQFGRIQREIHDAQLLDPVYQGIKDAASSSSKEEFISEDQGSSDLICSPFAGLCTVAAIKELNEGVIQELNAKGIEQVPQSLIRSPFSDKELLKSLAPDNLLKALDECQALERIPGGATRSMKEGLRELRQDKPSAEECSLT